MNSSPTDTSPMDVLTLARDLAAGVHERAAEADQSRRLPRDDIEALARSGYLGLSVPREHGGWEASLATCVAAQLELARGSAATALVATMTVHLLGHEREVGSWSKDNFRALAQAAVAGELINSAASEPAMGSPSRGGLPASRAVRDGDRFVIDGHKTWVTGGAHLSHLIVQLRLEERAVQVWVPADSAGVRWEETWGEGLSLRASDSHDLYLEGVRVPASRLLTRPNPTRAPSVWFPLMVAANYLGPALAAREAVIRYARERIPTALGRPIATLPGIQRQIGEIDFPLQAAETFLLATAEAWSGDQADREAFLPRAAAAKHLAIETALEATDRALRIAGAAGLDPALPLERYFRDVRAGLMHPPSGDLALELVGRAALGL